MCPISYPNSAIVRFTVIHAKVGDIITCLGKFLHRQSNLAYYINHPGLTILSGKCSRFGYTHGSIEGLNTQCQNVCKADVTRGHIFFRSFRDAG